MAETTNHVDQLLPELAADEIESGREKEVIERAIAASAGDPNAYLERDCLEALKAIRGRDPVEYEKLRTRFKSANGQIRMGALDDFTRQPNTGGENESIATQLASLAGDRCELWHDTNGEPFASLGRDYESTPHLEHWRIDSNGFREWLAWIAHTDLGTAPSSEAIKGAALALSGRAKFDGDEHNPAVRVAKTSMGYWLDMCDNHWQAILVTATGWKVVDKPPVRFIRNKAMRPLVLPTPSGSIEPLWALVNVPVEDRLLVLAWILESFRPDTPYPVLELIGEQGSAKSTTQETLRLFIDPNRVMLRGRPKTVEDVFVAAGANHVISLENLSGISPELSDALCTISTGGGQASRQFFTNGEEHIIEAHNPVMLNGIGAVVTRPDLLDRTVALCLPTIRDRMTEGEHATALESNASGIMGGLLDLFAQTLAGLGAVDIPSSDRPRMADFAQLGEAMNRAMGGNDGEWLAMYTAHRRDAIRRTIDSSPIAQACMEFVAANGTYCGTVKGLLDLFNVRMTAHNIERGEYWPRSPKGLADALRRAAPALRQIDIHLAVDNKPRRDGVHCELREGRPLSFSAPSHTETMLTKFTTFTDSPKTGEEVEVLII